MQWVLQISKLARCADNWLSHCTLWNGKNGLTVHALCDSATVLTGQTANKKYKHDTNMHSLLVKHTKNIKVLNSKKIDSKF